MLARASSLNRIVRLARSNVKISVTPGEARAGLTDILVIYPTAEGRAIEVVIYYMGPQQEEKVVGMTRQTSQFGPSRASKKVESSRRHGGRRAPEG